MSRVGLLNQLIRGAGIEHPSDVAVAGDIDGTYHVSFTTTGSVTFAKLDQLAEIFQTKMIDIGADKQESNGGCSSCYQGAYTYSTINLWEAKVDFPPEPPPPRRTQVKYRPPADAKAYCQAHLDQRSEAESGGWVRIQDGTAPKCNNQGCRKRSVAWWVPDEEVEIV